MALLQSNRAVRLFTVFTQGCGLQILTGSYSLLLWFYRLARRGCGRAVRSSPGTTARSATSGERLKWLRICIMGGDR
jgi:hypothetical protein